MLLLKLSPGLTADRQGAAFLSGGEGNFATMSFVFAGHPGPGRPVKFTTNLLSTEVVDSAREYLEIVRSRWGKEPKTAQPELSTYMESLFDRAVNLAVSGTGETARAFLDECNIAAKASQVGKFPVWLITAQLRVASWWFNRLNSSQLREELSTFKNTGVDVASLYAPAGVAAQLIVMASEHEREAAKAVRRQ